MGNNNSNQKKTKPNYFSTNINRFGESFLDMKNSRDIQNDAPRIFRELARKNITQSAININKTASVISLLLYFFAAGFFLPAGFFFVCPFLLPVAIKKFSLLLFYKWKDYSCHTGNDAVDWESLVTLIFYKSFEHSYTVPPDFIHFLMHSSFGTL